MSASLGRVTARLAHPDDETFSPDLVDLINANINPPTPVQKADVYIGAMYVVSDEVNSFGGRFPVEEHERLAHLLVDSPVLAGHRKDTLPLGRNFHATVVERDGRSWVKGYFYWLKSTEGAETLRENIEGGIYKECSIGFTFLFPECSVCGRDIRACPHEPSQPYITRDGDKSDPVTFNYRRIERVLETSLVYRGALPDTSVTREMAADGDMYPLAIPDPSEKVVAISSLSELDPDREYFMVPCYESLPLIVSCRKKVLTLQLLDGQLLDPQIGARFPSERLPEMDPAPGLLVGYRGKERCPVDQLQRYLAGLSSPVTRLEIKLFPPVGLALPKRGSDASPNKVRPVRHRIARLGELDQSARAIMTRKGVQLWPLDKCPGWSAGYRYRPSGARDETDSMYTLTFGNCSTSAFLSLGGGDDRLHFEIKQFSLTRLLHGARFIANKVENIPAGELPHNKSITRGNVTRMIQQDGGTGLELSGSLTGRFVLRSVKLNEHRRYLFYRVV
jgi:hypothetical protein